MADSFTHLHVHTEYSILDGASRLDDLIAAAVADGQPALGITDHGNMYGVLDFYRKCRDAGIKPIIGTEAYMAKDHRSERPNRRGGGHDDLGGNADSGGKLYYHLTLLAENNDGYKNLIQVSSRAFLEGYYYKPRCDWEILNEHSAGLIATTGCLGGQVPQALLVNDEREALERAGRLQEIFGRDNFFVEMQDHGIAEQARVNPRLLEIASKINAPLLATNDSHYTHRDDAEAHDALLCVQTNSRLGDANRFKFEGTEHYLKTAAEMRGLFGELDGACDNTLQIAERADVSIDFGALHLPKFSLPDGVEDDHTYLRQLVMDGAKARWGDPLTGDVLARVEYELGVIKDMGFASYFLITWDLVEFAKRSGIRVGPGRGSAAGCAVAYSLGITDLDPIRYGLLFERFLNPSRVSMPDIDIDFDSRYRDTMIKYTTEKYGRDRVAQIITFGRIKARAAIKDAARVLGYPYVVGDKITKAMPRLLMGRSVPIQEALNDTDPSALELRRLMQDNECKRTVEVALGLEDLRRQDGIHAAAVVIAPEPLTDYMPIQRKPEPNKPPEDAPIVTQYEMHGVEDLGLLKMDFLGLRNLDVITDCLALVEQYQGERIEMSELPLDDEATFEMLREGETMGVFQLESSQMRRLIQALQPTSFDDICALVALYRPGPMAANMHLDYAERKNGRQQVQVFHPDAEEILSETYGLMIYQESVMRVAQKFAGYSLADADTLRKAMGKKIREAMANERDRFISGCLDNGYAKELATHLFNTIEQFADYAFNKSHSYGYGLLAYQTAYLKANYPLEYFSALLTSVKSKLDTAGLYLGECRLRGIEVVVPDINSAGVDFAPSPTGEGAGRIVFGLSAVRHIGEGVARTIVGERKGGGRFKSFVDFAMRVDDSALNKGSIEALIYAGAFDSLGHPRQGLMEVSTQIASQASSARRHHAAGVVSLFDDPNAEAPSLVDCPAIPNIKMPRREKMSREQEYLGMYLSEHPLDRHADLIAEHCDRDVAELKAAVSEGLDLGPCTLGGAVTKLERRHTRKGDLMATFWLEDFTGNIEVIVFPRALKECNDALSDDSVVLVGGRVDSDRDSPALFLDNLEPLPDIPEDRPVRVLMTPECDADACLPALREIIERHPGGTPVHLDLGDGRVYLLADAFRVRHAPAFTNEVEVVMGDDSVSVAAVEPAVMAS